jgi:hypothetical protein
VGRFGDGLVAFGKAGFFQKQGREVFEVEFFDDIVGYAKTQIAAQRLLDSQNNEVEE